MVFIKFNQVFLLLIFSFTFLVDGLMTFKFSSGAKKPSSTQAHDKDILDTDLAAFVRPLSSDQSGVYSHAIELLTSMQASPSCNRLAAWTLLNSCQNIEGSAYDHEGSLDDTKSIYAAQLAMCEISSTGLDLHPECEMLKLTISNDGLRKPGGYSTDGKVNHRSQKKVGKRELSQCLRSLESRPQSWISYSNNRQNAVVMCQAARADTDRDDLIKLHKSMTQTSADVNAALFKALMNATEYLSRQYIYAITVDDLQRKSLQGLASSQDNVKAFIDKLSIDLDAAIQNIRNKMASALKDVEHNTVDVWKNLQRTNSEAVGLQGNVKKIFGDLQHSSSKFAASQVQQWEISQSLATQLQASLRNLGDTETQEVSVRLNKIHDQTHTLKNMIDKGLASADNFFAGFEARAEAISAVQATQLETQIMLSKKMDQLLKDLHSVLRLLAMIISSASSLQTIINQTSTKIAQLVTLGGLTSTLFQWGWLILMVFLVYQLKPRYAANAAAIIGFLILVRASGVPSTLQQKFSAVVPADTVLIHHASGYQVPVFSLLPVAAFIASASFLAVLYHRFCRVPAAATPAPGPELSSPFLKMVSQLRRSHDSRQM